MDSEDILLDTADLILPESKVFKHACVNGDMLKNCALKTRQSILKPNLSPLFMFSLFLVVNNRVFNIDILYCFYSRTGRRKNG